MHIEGYGKVMLTSSQEHIPHSVTSTEENVLCVVHHTEPQPQTVYPPSVLLSRVDVAMLSPRRRSGRLLKGKDQSMESVKAEDSTKPTNQHQINTSLFVKERGSWKSHEDNDKVQNQWPREKSTKGLKRKIEFPSVSSHSPISNDSSGVQEECSVDLEKKCPESPPPAKRWVIGPLLQSFKSKMASFTEIVMSPVRLFKQSDSTVSNVLPDQREQLSDPSLGKSLATKVEQADGESDGKDTKVFTPTRARIHIPQEKPTVVQRLRFNKNLSDLSDSDENKVVVSNRSESSVLSLSRSVPEEDASLKSSIRDLSSEVVEPVNVQLALHSRQDFKIKDCDVMPALGQSSTSNSSQEKSRFTKPGTADNYGLNLPHVETACSDTSSCSHSLSADADRKDLEDSCLSKPTRTCPRKLSERMFPLKSASKSFTSSLGENMLDDLTQYKHNNKTWIHPLSKDEVDLPLAGPEKKRKVTPKIETVRYELVKKATRSSKRTKKEANYEEKSLAVTLLRLSQSMTSPQIGRQRKVLVSDNSSLSTCDARENEIMGFSPQKSSSYNSSEREKIGQERASRSKSRGDAKCGTPTALGFGSLGRSSRSRNAMQHNKNSKIMLCKERKADKYLDGNVGEGELGESSGKDGYQEPEESSNSTHQEETEVARKDDSCQVNYKLDTYGVDSTGPATKRPLVLCKRIETRSVKAFNVEEQRLSMSLTLHVGAESDGEEKGNLTLPPVQTGSLDEWKAGRLAKSCRVTRRMGKVCTLAEEMDIPKSTLVPLKVQSLSDEDCRQLGKAKGKKKLSKINRKKRKCTSVARTRDDHDDEEHAQNRTEEAAPVVPSSGSGSNRLLRSFSCPDIPSLLHSDHVQPLAPLQDLQIPPSPPKKPCHTTTHPHHAHSPSKRARRHTVCSVEIEREIAPLCLRKEVHPTGWSSATNHVYSYSHASSLTDFVSCFLSSPLAFLSKKSSQGHTDYDFGLASTSPRSFTKSPSPSLHKSPTSPTLTADPAFSISVPPTPEHSSASISSPCSVFEPDPLEVDEVQRESEEDERSNFSLELSSRSISEEKALSDSEIKAGDKQVERRKVSSIRIRKTLPKPQYNLTPMGLPKAIRVKKKVFSVEEIYTNKNFNKPPEGRLETIFEVPLSRRDGSECLTGQKRVKRFVEFPELGVARKPRKPLVGGAGVGGAQRKGTGNSGAGRTRRGVWASSRDEHEVAPQDLDSALRSKLNELDAWMQLQQLSL
ncbi:uncharacterized protein prr14 [Hoplias malabaricus]|uniref:uncharacterized protein prr14 n=1 Tax=Hoplias malabaricus TaxID=27720 RepID=UPI0034637B58